MMLRRRRRATLRLYTSAVRKGVRVPKMLTVDEQFEAIIAGADVTAKMHPTQEPDPSKASPAEGQPVEGEPAEKKSGEEK